MNEVEKLAAEQFANIEITRFMMLDLWRQCLAEKAEPVAVAKLHRSRQLQSLQAAVDQSPDSFIRQALLGQAEENWRQILVNLEK